MSIYFQDFRGKTSQDAVNELNKWMRDCEYSCVVFSVETIYPTGAYEPIIRAWYRSKF